MITSHRWLDPRTCDIVNDKYPVGLRLTRLLERMDAYFSLKGFFQGQGFVGYVGRLDHGSLRRCKRIMPTRVERP